MKVVKMNFKPLGGNRDAEIRFEDGYAHVFGVYVTITSVSGGSMILEDDEVIELHRALGEVIKLRKQTEKEDEHDR